MDTIRPMLGAITEHYRSDATIVGQCNNLLVLIAQGPPAAREFDIVRRVGKEVMPQRWPSGIGLVLCSRAGTRPPEQAVRARIFATLEGLAPHTRAMACVVLGEGFTAATVRSVLAALTLRTRKSFPTKVFSDAASGVGWITTQLEGVDGSRFDHVALAKQVDRLATASLRPSSVSVG